ncbi:MAG: XRE family transcriptional regulator [Deltaproteobacteria bacterium]|nr:MAG: XRE family transcriptional regulator [Deltaproteobacteria bacterium]
MSEKTTKPYINVDYFEDLTGDIAETGQKPVEEIGARVSRLRAAKGLTLNQLARLTGFEENFLADIEDGKVQPQLGTVIKLSKALHSALGQLVSGRGDKLYSITRKDERKVISRSTSKTGQRQVYAYKDLAPEVKGRHMEALMVQLEENPEGELSVHEGEEFIHVMEGVVSLDIADDHHELAPGDTAYYPSTTPHLIAAKEGQATILAVIYDG